MKIGLNGGGFGHAFSTTNWKKPKTEFEWSVDTVQDCTFYIDASIKDGLNVECKRKFGWLVESRDIIPEAMEFVKNNHKLISEKYEILFTHVKEIYDLEENFHYIPPHGFWVESPKIYDKTKLVSMVSSSKGMTAGHRHRLGWVNRLRDKLDLYGRGFNPFDKKEDVLADYMFSVTIENDSYPTYWSEKILDCFACGTIPIYYGSPDIGDHFNMDGIIMLDESFDVSSLTPELYDNKIHAIKDNFERCMKLEVIEDIIYEKYLKDE
tara:strand:+ start:2828 stop:3625 length:798 start_codon:yes stop_codon:yes gene_type:complete